MNSTGHETHNEIRRLVEQPLVQTVTQCTFIGALGRFIEFRLPVKGLCFQSVFHRLAVQICLEQMELLNHIICLFSFCTLIKKEVN